MTLNGEMALILHYFTEFVYDVVVKQLLVLPRFQNILLIVYDHINFVCTTSPSSSSVTTASVQNVLLCHSHRPKVSYAIHQ